MASPKGLLGPEVTSNFTACNRVAFSVLVRRKAIVATALLVVGSTVVVVITRPTHFAFIDAFGGIEERRLEFEIRDFGFRTPSGELPIQHCIVFKTYAPSVLAAMCAELPKEGWNESSDPNETTFVKGDQTIRFMRYPFQAKHSETCIVVIPEEPGWLVKQWTAFRNQLGL